MVSKSSHRLFALFVATTTIMSTSALASAAGKFQLKYFNIRGVAELSRVMFALGDTEFDDVRYDFDMKTMKAPDFDAAKAAGEHTINMQRAPILVTPEGAAIGQSKTIERFLAKRFGLMGGTDVEEALVDCITEHCRDIKDAEGKKGFSAFSKNSEEEKKAARDEWFGTEMPVMLEKLDAVLKETSGEPGFSVGKSMTYADLAIWGMLRDCATSNMEETAECMKGCDSLISVADSMAENDKIKKWVEERPVTKF